jgi:hypothetical protein
MRLSKDSGGHLSQTPALSSNCCNPCQTEVGWVLSTGPQGAIEAVLVTQFSAFSFAVRPQSKFLRGVKAVIPLDVLPFKRTRNEFLTMNDHLKLPRLSENDREFNCSFRELYFTWQTQYSLCSVEWQFTNQPSIFSPCWALFFTGDEVCYANE